MDIQIEINRDFLVLDELVITTSCDITESNYWIRYNTLFRPGFEARRRYSPETTWAPPKLLASVKESAILAFSVMVQATSSSELATKMTELETALSQFEYDVTMIVDGVSEAWQADACLPGWGTVNYQLQDHNMAIAAIQIPINPNS